MQLLRAGREHADIRLSWDELRLVSNALNEVCHGFELPEFHTRLGSSLDVAKVLLDQIGAVIDQAQSTN
jgi:hypothetical protein